MHQKLPEPLARRADLRSQGECLLTLNHSLLASPLLPQHLNQLLNNGARMREFLLPAYRAPYERALLKEKLDANSSLTFRVPHRHSNLVQLWRA